MGEFPNDPLDEILGTRGRVRVLRVLARSVHPTWPVDIAGSAGVSRSTCWRVLDELFAAGIVDRLTGTDRSYRYQLSSRHRLGRTLALLFALEADLGTERGLVRRGERDHLLEMRRARRETVPFRPVVDRIDRERRFRRERREAIRRLEGPPGGAG